MPVPPSVWKRPPERPQTAPEASGVVPVGEHSEKRVLSDTEAARALADIERQRGVSW